MLAPFYKQTPVNRAAVNTNNFIRNSPYSNSYRIHRYPVRAGDQKFVSGSLPAVLPMTIAIPDVDGKRLEFVMLINPSTVNHGKTQAYVPSYTRDGYVVQLWGPNMDTLSSTGKTAALMTENGLAPKFKSSPLAFLNFGALINTYRSNGYQILDESKSEKLSRISRVIKVVSGVEIFYDGNSFLGHFNNFTLEESADTPFIFNYNFEFIVSALSSEYSRTRGHFISMPQRTSEENPTELESNSSRPISNYIPPISETVPETSDYVLYTVTGGDVKGISDIVGSFDSAKAVMAYNGMSSDLIRPGDKIKIPKNIWTSSPRNRPVKV